jgi:hypothetical protein
MDRPSKDASRGDWDKYAKSLDLNPDEYSNKEALIEAVEAEEVASAVDGEDGEDGNFDSAITREDLDAGEPEAAINADTLGEGKPLDVTPGKKGKYPDGYEDATDGWKAAYDHAVSFGNPEKTAIVFADINCDNAEFND